MRGVEPLNVTETTGGDVTCHTWFAPGFALANQHTHPCQDTTDSGIRESQHNLLPVVVGKFLTTTYSV